MSDIVVSGAKKINILDKIIQNVVIMVNMSKMNRAIDEHLDVIKNTERDDQKQYQENILREIVYVKYQYDIMQRTMYELKLSYSDEIVDNINSVDKTERLKLQKDFLEMEYDRISKNKFKNKENIKYMLLIISSVIQTVKQDIKDEGKKQKYNAIMRCAEEVDTKVLDGTYTETCYVQFFEYLKNYVNYINDNYDISKLPVDEKEIIELVIESTLKGLESDVDVLNYEYSLVINVCQHSYRYFKIVDKVFGKIQHIYDESLERDSINMADYLDFYEEIYDQKIKVMVNDVHRSIRTEDEYLEYSRQIHEAEGITEFITERAIETTESEKVREILLAEIEKYKEEKEEKEEQEEGQQIIDEVKDVAKEDFYDDEPDETQEEIEITEQIYELDGQTSVLGIKEEETANI